MIGTRSELAGVGHCKMNSNLRASPVKQALSLTGSPQMMSTRRGALALPTTWKPLRRTLLAYPVARRSLLAIGERRCASCRCL
jgi:hypothetical protein